jgi:hypothetical protein
MHDIEGLLSPENHRGGWKLATLAELPYQTTVLSDRVDVGDQAGPRAIVRQPSFL